MAALQELRMRMLMLMPSIVATHKISALTNKTRATALGYFIIHKRIPLNYFTLTQYHFYPLLSFLTRSNFIKTPTLK